LPISSHPSTNANVVIHILTFFTTMSISKIQRGLGQMCYIHEKYHDKPWRLKKKSQIYNIEYYINYSLVIVYGYMLSY